RIASALFRTWLVDARREPMVFSVIHWYRTETGRDMKSRKQQQKRQTAFRLPPVLIAKLDRIAAQMAAEHPGLALTRADVVRMLLTRAVEQEEARHHGKS